MNRKGEPQERAESVVTARNGRLRCDIDWGSPFNRGDRVKFECSNGRVGSVKPAGKLRRTTTHFYRGATNRAGESAFLWTGNEIGRMLGRAGQARQAGRQCRFEDTAAAPPPGREPTADPRSDAAEEASRTETRRDPPRETRSLTGRTAQSAQRLGLSAAEATLLLGAVAVSDRATRAITDTLARRGANCARASIQFRADCLRQGYRALADLLPQTGDYSGVRQSLAEVSKELDQIVSSTGQRSNRAELTIRSGTRSVRETYTGVRPRGQERAAAAVQSAQARLLRSVPSSDPRQVHYQRVVAAYGGNVVLLRS